MTEKTEKWTGSQAIKDGTEGADKAPEVAGTKAPQTEDKKDEKKDKKEPVTKRSAFASLYPEDQKLTLLVEKNPKKEGSKSRARFEHYFTSQTVGDFRAKGGTYQDIAYDVGRQHIKVG